MSKQDSQNLTMLHEEDNNNILGTVNLSYIYIYIYISYKLILHIVTGTVMAVNVCWLDLHPSMMSWVRLPERCTTLCDKDC